MPDPIVLISGLQSGIASWMPLIDEMDGALPLCIPSGHQQVSTIEAMADVVLAQSPLRFHMAGWSMGGYVALDILRRAPERVLSLIMISTTAAPESRTACIARDRSLEIARREGMHRYQHDNLVKCVHAPNSLERHRLEKIVRASEALGLGAFERQTTAIRNRSDGRPVLAASTLPLLLIAGTQDPVIPVAEAREMHRLRPDATYHEIPDCGHCPPLEYPGLVAHYLGDWIARQNAPATFGARE